MTIEQRLVDLGVELPTPPDPIASYVSFRMSGGIAYLSGHGPLLPDGSWIVGKVGRDLGIEEAHDAARVTNDFSENFMINRYEELYGKRKR